MRARESGSIVIVPGCDRRRNAVAAASVFQSRFATLRDVRAAVTPELLPAWHLYQPPKNLSRGDCQTALEGMRCRKSSLRALDPLAHSARAGKPRPAGPHPCQARRPRIKRDRRFTWAYLSGAICPARGTGAALVMPVVSIEAMNKHLAEISQCAGVRAIALPILDGAGWPSPPRPVVPENIVLLPLPPCAPENIVLLPLPPCAPELNSTGNIWEYLRGNCLSPCVFDSCEAILDACCDAWNAPIAKSEVIASIGTRDWAQVKS